MESLYHQTNKLIQEVQNDLGRVERATGMCALPFLREVGGVL